MINKRIIPFLMLHMEQLYKSVQFSNYTYIGDPLIAVKIFNEMLAEEICIVDVDPSRYGKPIQFELLSDIAGECFMPLCYGGGINSSNDVRKILYSGFEKISINSVVHSKGFSFVEELVSEFGSSTIVVSVDYKMTPSGLTVFSNGGTKNTGVKLIEFIKKINDLNVGEVVLNCIDRDGMMTGLDLVTLSEVSKLLNNPIIGCGGVGNIIHITEGIDAGVNAVGAGSLFVYKGALKAVLINYPNESVINSIKKKK